MAQGLSSAPQVLGPQRVQFGSGGSTGLLRCSRQSLLGHTLAGDPVTALRSWARLAGPTPRLHPSTEHRCELPPRQLLNTLSRWPKGLAAHRGPSSADCSLLIMGSSSMDSVILLGTGRTLKIVLGRALSCSYVHRPCPSGLTLVRSGPIVGLIVLGFRIMFPRASSGFSCDPLGRCLRELVVSESLTSSPPRVFGPNLLGTNCRSRILTCSGLVPLGDQRLGGPRRPGRLQILWESF